ncbi:MAG TPA: palindromic element RPE4 domain-containing protein [Rickettsia endosymbiont of Proechinophthirus fluctus]|nr:palindromic element RPE4 domain-containing protein [Rickettsia endosymbiont of Proechinophthirus fluctus]
MSIFNYFLDTVVKPRYDTEYAFQSIQPLPKAILLLPLYITEILKYFANNSLYY